MTREELLQIAKPILFNTDMVCATLDGRKTVTRRLVKKSQCMLLNKKDPSELKREGLYAPFDGMTDTEIIASTYKSPYQPGDILYVRETWCWEPCWDCGMDTEEHNCCDESAQRIFNHDKGEYGCYIYRASVENNVYPSVGVWYPSIHMPKQAARIWLKVTDVRVERLQYMSTGDFLAEGVRPEAYNDPENAYQHAKKEFIHIWDSTVKKSEINQYGWEADPWVWVIEFERCGKPG